MRQVGFISVRYFGFCFVENEIEYSLYARLYIKIMRGYRSCG